MSGAITQRLTASLVLGSLGLLTACLDSRTITVEPSPSPATPAPSPIATASPMPPRPVVGDPYERAVTKAKGATNLAQSAQSKQDWELVVIQWQKAIELMNAVPPTSEHYATAQKLVKEYENRVTQAQQQIQVIATRPSPDTVKPNPAATQTAMGNIGISGEGLSVVSNLLQSQLVYYNQNRRFAPRLADLSNTLPNQTESYRYRVYGQGARRAYIKASPRRQGLLSYTGVIYITRNGNQEQVVTGICGSTQPSRLAPTVPRVRDNRIECRGASELVN